MQRTYGCHKIMIYCYCFGPLDPKKIHMVSQKGVHRSMQCTWAHGCMHSYNLKQSLVGSFKLFLAQILRVEYIPKRSPPLSWLCGVKPWRYHVVEIVHNTLCEKSRIFINLAKLVTLSMLSLPQQRHPWEKKARTSLRNKD